MSDLLPEAVRAGLEQARKDADRKRARRIKLRVGDQTITVRRHWDEGFAIDREDAPALRGYVDLYDGGKHLCRALIVTTADEGDERVFEYKRATEIADGPAADFVQDETPPIALIPRF